MIGQTVSHYRILEKLGRGGMGVVYKAEDLRLQRPVALKFLSRDLVADPAAKTDFIHEARAASRLEHPNICTIHDVEETTDGRMFISMAFCQGETLRARIARGPMPVDEILPVAGQILTGLERAHAGGIVHRDIKPDNIMISPDGIVKILDFGIAKSVHEGSAATRTAGFGTLSYMSPEQIRGESTDARTDIWAFGVTLFEMATGRLPFTGLHPPALMYQIMNEAPADVRALRKDLPASVAAAIDRCLAKDRDARPSSAAEILSTFQADRQPALVARRAQGWSVKRLLLVLSGLAVASAAVWLAVTLLFPSAPPGRYRIAILPLYERTKGNVDESFATNVQSFLAGELTGFKEFGVLDNNTVNSRLLSTFHTLRPERGEGFYNALRAWNVDYIIEIDRIQSPTDNIHLSIKDPRDPEMPPRFFKTARTDLDLLHLVPRIAREITDYFHISRNKDDNLKPWYSISRNNLEAIEAFLQASRYFMQGRRGGERNLHDAISHDSGFIAPRVWLISSLLGRGAWEEAIAEQTAIERLQTSANGFESAMIDFMRARILNNLPQQKAALERALDYSPENNIILVNLAYRKYALDDPEGALATLEHPLKEGWPYPLLYTTAADCCFKLKNPKQAVGILRTGLRLNPESEFLFAWLAAMAPWAEEGDSARRYESNMIRSSRMKGSPEDAARELLGSAYESIENYPAALAMYRAAIALNPSCGRYFFKAAKMQQALKQPAEARHSASTALELDSTLFHAHYLLGELSEQSGDTLRALGHYRQYVRHDYLTVEALKLFKRYPALAASIPH